MGFLDKIKKNIIIEHRVEDNGSVIKAEKKNFIFRRKN